MNIVTKKGPIYDPGICRCCGLIKRCRILNHEYEWMGEKEIYCDMFMDSFGLLLSHLDGEPLERLICATCVSRLREASSFRKQVLRCEELLLQARLNGQEQDAGLDTLNPEEVKLEDLPACDDGMDYLDEDLPEIEPKNTKKTSKRKKKSLKSRVKKSFRLKEQSEIETDGDEMLMSLAKMSERLRRIEDQDDVKESKVKQKSSDIDHKLLSNASAIVENSFVCPFDTSFSDYYCIYCREMYTDPTKLREHTMTHDPSTFREIVIHKKLLQVDVFRIDCRLCADTIDNIDSLKTHLVTTHGINIYEVTNEFLKFRLTINNLTCIECGCAFSFFHALKKHMAEHFGSCICDVCGAHYFEERMLILHQKSHQKIEENFACKECNKTFKSKHSRNLHVSRTHKKEPSYLCYKCDEVFFSYSQRYRHMIDAHNEQRLFPCEQCDRAYDSRKSLREHNRRYHLKIFKHQCDLCDKRFYLPSRLKEHLAVHTGERNFRCEYCGKSYPRLRGLKVHMQSHSADKKFKCVLCNASFTQNINLKNHIKRQHQNLDLEEQYQE